VSLLKIFKQHKKLIMKKHFLLAAICLTILASVNAAGPDNAPKKISATEKAMKNFHRHYQDVSAEVWKQIRDGYEASFEVDGRTTKAFYNTKGNWIYTISYFKASNLPVDLIQTVKEENDKYYIAGAEKIDVPAGSAYIVHLENNDEYKTISLSGNEVKVINQFEKAK
jgi:hypothetical protein